MQIPLMELPSPLDQTVGSSFFAELPKVPGVYRMYGDRGELLYVGKAKNLRTRLMSYRRVKIGHPSTKSLRLVHSVSKIEIEECESEVHALVKENELLRLHRPPFNVVNTRPDKYFYFVVQVQGDLDHGATRATLRFSLSSEVEGAVFGAYKGLSLCHRTFFALRRIFWVLNEVPGDEPFRYPLELFRKQKLAPHEFVVSKEELNLLAGFLHGYVGSPIEKEPALIRVAREHFAKFSCDEFHRNWIVEDLETLQRFFTVGPLRNQGLKTHSRYESPVIGQDHLDDLMVFKTVRHSSAGRA